jgi:hypothetical protein
LYLDLQTYCTTVVSTIPERVGGGAMGMLPRFVYPNKSSINRSHKISQEHAIAKDQQAQPPVDTPS